MDQNEINHEIESRFQIALTLSIFFPTFLSNFLESAKMEIEKINSVTLSWTTLVGLYILNYVFFCILKKLNVPNWIYKSISCLLVIGIALFIFPLAILTSQYKFNESVIHLFLSIYKFSLDGLFSAPCAILTLMLIGAIIDAKRYKGPNTKIK